MLAWTLLLFALLPIAEPVTDEVDQLHIETYYDQDAKFVFKQYIFRDLDHDGKYRIIDWRLEKCPAYINNGTMIWHDGNTLRRVRYNVLIEDHSQVDSELSERAEWPKEWRRELTPPLNVMRREMKFNKE